MTLKVTETKRWPPKHFGELGRRLQADGFDVVLIGARGDTEACTGVERIAFGCANLCGATSLGQLAALVQGAALVVANDSGPMHLAAALSRPVVAIFGPTDPLWVGPYGQSAAVIAAGVSCAPCYLRRMSQCPHAHVCLEGLKVTEVARHCATAPRAMA